jgi:dsDNA-specific endonuclease/ATPase MutS2
MPPKFNSGDQVVVLNESGHFIFKDFKNSRVVVLVDEHKFEREFPIEQVSLVRGAVENLLKINAIPKEKLEKKSAPKLKPNFQDNAVIDLHMHEIVDSHQGWTNTQIVQYQLEYLRKQLEVLMRKRVRRVEIVHGVGDQVLMKEVRTYLRKFKGCEINDKSYTRNGFGATEFIIRYKGNV